MIKNYKKAIDNANVIDMSHAKNNLVMINQYATQVTNELSKLDPNGFALAPTNTTVATFPTLIVVQPTAPQPAAVCSCSGDLYNCSKSDFPSKAAAQACYDYCKSIGFGDVHGLDRNNDGEACDEGLK